MANCWTNGPLSARLKLIQGHAYRHLSNRRSLQDVCKPETGGGREEVEPRRVKDGCCSPRRNLNRTGKEPSEKWLLTRVLVDHHPFQPAMCARTNTSEAIGHAS